MDSLWDTCVDRSFEENSEGCKFCHESIDDPENVYAVAGFCSLFCSINWQAERGIAPDLYGCTHCSEIVPVSDLREHCITHSAEFDTCPWEDIFDQFYEPKQTKD